MDKSKHHAAKKLRTALGWSQEKMAAELGCNVGTVSRIEACKHPVAGPVWKLLQRIAQDHGEEKSLVTIPQPKEGLNGKQKTITREKRKRRKTQEARPGKQPRSGSPARGVRRGARDHRQAGNP